ncbi:MAG: 4-hydroxy-tetrahydrodipicolinate synthase [Halothiobacillaceae bacterium]|jgi:4-hydroxy-tetrahydrodipicolinate synthase|nr:4-hydroxy-tetrahydrodipicolinate synthase [Halothiobacillaceae bacterium]
MFHGSLVALVTPMRPDGALDFEALARLVEFHVEKGTDALVVMGTTGESATLDVDEHIEVVRRSVALAAGRLPVIAGTGANSTREAIELTEAARREGVDGCLLVTPYYNKPTQEGLYRHYRAIAEAVALPQILYNVPGRTGCDMQPATVERLADIPNIVGIKEASGSLERTAELIRRCGDRMDVFSGDDAIAREVILQGGRGVISVTANVAPEAMHRMCAAALAGETENAARIDAPLAGLHAQLFCESNPIPVKWALWRMGLIDTGIRLPLTPLGEACQGPVSEAMRQAGLIS